jgi:SsrA-binding protein
MKKEGIKPVAQNKKARFDFEILSTTEAGIVLTGTEIKSVRDGRVQLQEGYAKITDGEAFLVDTYIAPYANAGPFNHDPVRPRKLLLHKREIQKLYGKTQEKGLSLLPLRLYLKNGKAKVELGLGRGKRKYEKRDTLRKEDARKEIQRSLKLR